MDGGILESLGFELSGICGKRRGRFLGDLGIGVAGYKWEEGRGACLATLGLELPVMGEMKGGFDSCRRWGLSGPELPYRARAAISSSYFDPP